MIKINAPPVHFASSCRDPASRYGPIDAIGLQIW